MCYELIYKIIFEGHAACDIGTNIHWWGYFNVTAEAFPLSSPTSL